MMMMASSIIQCCRHFYSSKSSLIHNYSLAAKSYAKCQTMALSYDPPRVQSVRRRMQSVFDTTSWCSQQQRLLPSQVSPWLMLTPELTLDKDHDKAETVSKVVYKFYDVRANKVMSFEGDSGVHLQLHNRAGDAFKGSSHGWLAEFDSSTRDLFLYNPISRRRLKLPTMDTLPLRGTPREGAIDLNDAGKLSSDCIVKKVILSSSDPVNDEGCVAMMLYGADSRLACCHPARGGGQWYPLGYRHWEWDEDEKRKARSYQDVAYSAREKLFFCITKDGDELEAWDSTALLAYDMPISIKKYFEEKDDDKKTSVRRCERELYLKGLCRYHERYLVVAEPYDHRHGGPPSQQLFLVLRHKIRLWDGVLWHDEGMEIFNYDFPLQTVAFDVRRFDVEKRKLVHMDRTLDGLALFVGKNHSFAVKAGDFNGLKPNSIYFTDSEPQDDPKLAAPNKYGGHDNGVYNYEDGTFSSCYYPCEHESYTRMVPAPMWFSPLHVDHKIAS